MVATQGDVTRLRVILEGERAFAMGGEDATFTPSAEVGPSPRRQAMPRPAPASRWAQE